MTLGERIYALRTERNLSQTDLAEQLDVSRQSVSKWETDASVPDLDKLVKLCDLFGVTMDELVRGTACREERPEAPVLLVRDGKGPSSREIMGIVLVALGILGVLVFLAIANVGFALFMVPLVICGAICFVAKGEVRMMVSGGFLVLGIAIAVVLVVETGDLLEGLLAFPVLVAGALGLIVK